MRSFSHATPRGRGAIPARRWRAILRRPLFTLGVVLGLAAQAAPVAPRMLLLDGAVAGNAIVAVGERGTILRSTDGGTTWEPATVPALATLTGVSFADPQHGWAVGHDALILATADGGRSWTRQWQGELTDSFLDVLAIDASHAIAVGAYGLFAETADGGHTWARRKIIPDDYHLNRISRGPTGTLYVAGEHGTVLRSRDGGGHWDPLTLPYDGSFYGVLPLDRTTLIAYGLRGRAYRSTDDGATWTEVRTGASELLATAARLDGNVALAGQARMILLSSDGGTSFVPAAGGVTSGVAELIPLGQGRLLALGEAGATILVPTAPHLPAPAH